MVKYYGAKAEEEEVDLGKLSSDEARDPERIFDLDTLSQIMMTIVSLLTKLIDQE